MRSEERFWIAVWSIVAFLLLGFFIALFTFLQTQHRWDVGRDEYLMRTCKILTKTVSDNNGGASTIRYQCERSE